MRLLAGAGRALGAKSGTAQPLGNSRNAAAVDVLDAVRVRVAGVLVLVEDVEVHFHDEADVVVFQPSGRQHESPPLHAFAEGPASFPCRMEIKHSHH